MRRSKLHSVTHAVTNVPPSQPDSVSTRIVLIANVKSQGFCFLSFCVFNQGIVAKTYYSCKQSDIFARGSLQSNHWASWRLLRSCNSFFFCKSEESCLPVLQSRAWKQRWFAIRLSLVRLFWEALLNVLVVSRSTCPQNRQSLSGSSPEKTSKTLVEVMNGSGSVCLVRKGDKFPFLQPHRLSFMQLKMNWGLCQNPSQLYFSKKRNSLQVSTQDMNVSLSVICHGLFTKQQSHQSRICLAQEPLDRLEEGKRWYSLHVWQRH